MPIHNTVCDLPWGPLTTKHNNNTQNTAAMKFSEMLPNTFFGKFSQGSENLKQHSQRRSQDAAQGNLVLLPCPCGIAACQIIVPNPDKEFLRKIFTSSIPKVTKPLPN